MMRRLMQTVTAALLAATLAVGCGGDDDPPPGDPDAMGGEPDGGGGGTPDGGNPLTFEEYVIDMIENRTSDTTNAAPSTEFESLPESGDPNAFDSLF